jgi:hypothetical protein
MPGLPGMGRKAKRAAQGKKGGKKGPGRAGGGPARQQPVAPQLPPNPLGLPQGQQQPDPLGLFRNS